MAVESNYHVFFGLFGNRLKVGIISALRREHMGVNELSKKLGEESSKISHALLVLNKCHIVEAEQKGKNRVYSLNKDTMVPLMRLVDRHVEKHCKYCWAESKSELGRRS